MEMALVSLSLKTEDKAAESKEPAPSQNPGAPQTQAPSAAQVPTALKGVSQSLLDRVGGRVDQLSWGSGFYLLLAVFVTGRKDYSLLLVEVFSFLRFSR